MVSEATGATERTVVAPCFRVRRTCPKAQSFCLLRVSLCTIYAGSDFGEWVNDIKNNDGIVVLASTADAQLASLTIQFGATAFLQRERACLNFIPTIVQRFDEQALAVYVLVRRAL